MGFLQIESDADEEEWDEVEDGDEDLLENENHVGEEEENLSAISEMRLVPRDPNGRILSQSMTNLSCTSGKNQLSQIK